jgi:hypothetical protein
MWSTLHYIPEDGSIHAYRCENLKLYNQTWFNAASNVVHSTVNAKIAPSKR